MDPLSFTASLFAIIGGAQAGAKALKKLTTYRHAPQEIGALVAELERFELLLQQTVTLVEDIDDTTLKARGQILAQEVEKASEKIEDINRLLSAPHALISRFNDGERAKAIWMQNKRKIRTILGDLKDAWVIINYALGVLTASSTQGMRQSINTCIALGEANSDSLALLLERVATIEDRARRSGVPTDNNGILSGSTAPPTLEVTTVACLPISERPAMKLSQQRTPAASQKCKPWCSCRCHFCKTLMMPYLLTSVLGHFALEYVSTRPNCNERSCLNAKTTSLHLNYSLPWYMASRKVSFTMNYTPFYGTRYNLRMPRIMDWGHLLWKHANQGNIVAIQKMFSEGKASPFDVNPLGQTALNYAAQHPRLYRLLVENGSDQDMTDLHGYKPCELIGQRLLSAELEDEDAHAISQMLDETDFMETRQFATIHKIVLGIVRKDLIEELGISTASINSIDSKGRTPLAWATIRDNQRAVDALLAFGADPNICDKIGDSCLHFARSREVCSALLDREADVRTVNKTFGANCMQAICKRRDKPELIDLLHGAGADVNHRDKDGETPLLNAIFKRHTSISRRLIELGADVNTANHSSWDTAILFAVSFDHHEILEMLLEHGANYRVLNKQDRNLAHVAAQSALPNTLKTLTTLNLAGLEVFHKDARGKTAEDYLNERHFLADSETETREAFMIFQQSILDGVATPDQGSSADVSAQADGEYLLLGAYPA